MSEAGSGGAARRVERLGHVPPDGLALLAGLTAELARWYGNMARTASTRANSIGPCEQFSAA